MRGGRGPVVIRNFDISSSRAVSLKSWLFVKQESFSFSSKNLKIFKNTRVHWNINIDGIIHDNRSYRECKIKFIPFEQINHDDQPSRC